jgi:hypothetical protein
MKRIATLRQKIEAASFAGQKSQKRKEQKKLFCVEHKIAALQKQIFNIQFQIIFLLLKALT